MKNILFEVQKRQQVKTVRFQRQAKEDKYSYLNVTNRGLSKKLEASGLLKPCSDERQNGFKSLKVRCNFLQPSFTPCEHDCFCLKTLKHFRFKCLRRFFKINFFFDFLKPFQGLLKQVSKINHVFY